MNKSRHEKLTVTLKEAMVRNAMAEQRMKAEVGVMHTDVSKQIQSMKAFQTKYEKRQKELQQMRATRHLKPEEESPSRPTSSTRRKVSAPATLSVETIDLNATSAERSPRVQKRRSMSSVTLPKLEVSSYDDFDKLPALQTRSTGPRLPTLNTRPASASPGRQNHIHPTRPKSATLSVDRGQQFLSKSAPSSPSALRKGQSSPAFGTPVSGRSISPTASRFEDILEVLQKVQQKKTPDLDSFASISEWRRLKNGEIAASDSSDDEDDKIKHYQEDRSDKAKKGKQKPSKPHALPLPGTTLSSSAAPGDSDRDDSPTLAESMDKIKYCKYLRHSAYEDAASEQLPKELIPNSIIVGSIRTVDFSGE